MGGVPLRETVVKQVQAAGVPVWHRLAPRHWHRHATGAELCFRAIFPSLAIALATVSTAQLAETWNRGLRKSHFGTELLDTATLNKVFF